MNDNRGSADVYDSPLDLNNTNDPRALALGLIAPGKAVLELGPATGRVTRVLKQRGCRVVAVEQDGNMAANLEPYCSRVIVGDVERLSLPEAFGEQRFDVILAGDFLEHLAHPLELLQQLKPYLSEDGYVVASIPNIAHGSVRLALLQGKFEYRDIGILDRTHLRFFTLESILRLFCDAGFAVVDVQRVRQDPYREPYIDRPRLDDPELSPEVKKLIEDDPDAATAQFVVKAFPVTSSTGLLNALLRLQAQIQEKEKRAFSLEKVVLELRNSMQAAEHEVRRLEICLQQAEGKIRERESAITELRARNEMLTAWLTKYKNVKERFLPPGSLRDRIARKLVGSSPAEAAPDAEPASETQPNRPR
jgi:O-antigen biosynthesis protein